MSILDLTYQFLRILLFRNRNVMSVVKKQRMMVWVILFLLILVLYSPRFRLGESGNISFSLWVFSIVMLTAAGFLHYNQLHRRGKGGEYFLFISCSVVMYGCGQGFLPPVFYLGLFLPFPAQPGCSSVHSVLI